MQYTSKTYENPAVAGFMGPFSRMLSLLIGVGRVGHRFSALYGNVAAVLVFIAIVEAFWFAIKHFKRIRDFKKGWRQRMAPAHFSWITKRSVIMCVIEPVMVAVLIILCGVCVAATWPLWVPIVTLVSVYDTIHYVIRKVKTWRTGAEPTNFHFNKVQDFPWIYGDFDGNVINEIRTAAATVNGNSERKKKHH